MNIGISPADIDQTHITGKKKAGQNKAKPIIVELSRHIVKRRILSNKGNPERVQYKYSGKLNIKVHGNSKESEVKASVHRCVNI